MSKTSTITRKTATGAGTQQAIYARKTLPEYLAELAAGGYKHIPSSLINALLGGMASREEFLAAVRRLAALDMDDDTYKALIHKCRRRGTYSLAEIVGDDALVALHLCRAERPTPEIVAQLAPGPGFCEFFAQFPLLGQPLDPRMFEEPDRIITPQPVPALEVLEERITASDPSARAIDLGDVLEHMFLTGRSDSFRPFKIVSIGTERLRRLLQAVSHCLDYSDILAKLFLCGLDVAAATSDVPTADRVIGCLCFSERMAGAHRWLAEFQAQFPGAPVWPALLAVVGGPEFSQLVAVVDAGAGEGAGEEERVWQIACELDALDPGAACEYLHNHPPAVYGKYLLRLYLDASGRRETDLGRYQFDGLFALLEATYGEDELWRFATDAGNAGNEGAPGSEKFRRLLYLLCGGLFLVDGPRVPPEQLAPAFGSADEVVAFAAWIERFARQGRNICMQLPSVVAALAAPWGVSAEAAEKMAPFVNRMKMPRASGKKPERDQVLCE